MFKNLETALKYNLPECFTSQFDLDIWEDIH